MSKKNKTITNLEFFEFSEERLEEIRKKSILECYDWWGLKYPGFGGMIITKDNEMYSYNYYIRIPNELKGQSTNYIVKNKVLKSKDYKKVKNFIEKELLNKQFDQALIRDASYDVIINYNGVKTELYNCTPIYNKTTEFMKKILNQKENFIVNILNKLKNIFSNINIGEKYELNLLKKYGKCKELKKYGINILFITDTHNCMSTLESYLKNINITEFDICITLGDISGNDFEIIKKYIPTNKLYGIVGNHDSIDMLEQNGITNINGQVIECNGVRIAAIMGSNRYKSGDYGMLTQEECLELEQNMKYADILVSHDKAYIYDKHDNVHDGLKGITDYIYRNHIPLHIHGHLHEEYEETLKNGTKSIGLYKIKLLEL